MKQIQKTVCAAVLLLCLCACTAPQARPLSKNGFLLDTVITITLYDSEKQEVLDEAFRLISQYEGIFSRTDPDSEVYRLNSAQGAPVTVSEPLLAVLERAQYYAEITDGKFDVTVCPVTQLWDFTAEEPSLPDPDALQTALQKVGWRNLVIEGASVRLENGAEIDLGGIAKGYVADRVADYLKSEGVQSAIIDLGGNIVVVGGRPDGSPFRIGVQEPFAQRKETLGTMEIRDLSVVSSGVYERSFTLDAQLYHHILDPATGYPAQTGLLGVTVVAPASVDSDALSTSLFLLGPDEGMALAEHLGVQAMFVDEQENASYTPGFLEELQYHKN